MAHIQDRWYTKNRTRTARYGKGLRWQVEWVDQSGAKRKKSFQNKDLAEDHLTEVRHELKRGVYRAPNRVYTVDDVMDQWVASNPERSSGGLTAIRGQYRRNFQPRLGNLAAHQVTRAQIQNAVNALLLDLAPNTVRNSYSTLASAMKWAAVEQIIPINPCQGIRLPKVPKTDVQPLSIEQVYTIADGMKTAPMRAMALMAAATGMRSGELRGATWENITGRTLLVDRQRSWNGPGFVPVKTPSSVRRITLDAETMAMLQAFRNEHGEGEDRLMFHHDGIGYSGSSLPHAWRSMRDATGLDIAGWHQLRHFHASRLIHTGFSPVAVARRLGHKDANETLKTYGHMWPSDDEAMASAGALTLHTPSDRPNFRVISGV